MTDAGLAKRSALELAELIRAGEVSPVEVLDASLAAIERLNPVVNAIITLADDAARKSAIAAEQAVSRGDELGLLHGLPVVIKDITETADIRTTYASALFIDNVPKEDAEVVARLKRAGAIILGKTNTPEFATGANTVNDVFGATVNPWNTALSASGSSGGSAVAVATGMVPIAHGPTSVAPCACRLRFVESSDCGRHPDSFRTLPCPCRGIRDRCTGPWREAPRTRR